jgi:tetratricopeptide (TPR) repeat protein
MGAFIDLVPNLLRLPGALGCSPEAIGFLKRLIVYDEHAVHSLSAGVRDSELISGCITQAISEMLDALATESTLVLVVEDAQWLDAISLRVLADLIAERKQRSLLLVLTSRQPTLYTDSGYEDRPRALKVQPLGVDASRFLLTQLVASRGVDAEPAFLDWSLGVAAGNPFFLHALAAHYAATRDCSELPEPLSALLAHRLKLLDARSRRIFEACSVLGRHATLERLERLLGIPPMEFLDGLDVLERHGFVRCEGARVQTSHALLSDLAVRSSSPGVRALLHRNAAKVLEQCGTDRANPTLHWDCAEHWIEAGETAYALARLRSCARHALEIGRPDDACELLYRAETLSDTTSERIAILEERILAHEIAGGWSHIGEDVQTYLQLAAQHDVPVDRYHPYRILALESRMRRGEDPSSFLADLRAFASDSAAPTPVRVRAASAVMMLAEDLMSPDLAAEAFDAVGPARLDDSDTSPGRVGMELIYYALLGRLNDSITLARRAVDYAGRTPGEDCRVLSLCGFALLRAGQLAEGRSMFEQCFRKASRYRLYSLQLHAAVALACVLRDAELYPDALHWHGVATELLRRGSGRLSLGYFANAVLFAIDRRDFECAVGWLDRASEIPAVRSGYPELIFLALRIRVRQLDEGYVCSEAEVHELLKGHFKARGLGHHDEVVVTLWHALATHGRTSYGDELLRDYLVDHRKMRWPLCPELRQLALLLRPPINSASEYAAAPVSAYANNTEAVADSI